MQSIAQTLGKMFEFSACRVSMASQEKHNSRAFVAFNDIMIVHVVHSSAEQRQSASQQISNCKL